MPADPSRLIDCPECGGCGEVAWNPSPINDPQCVETATCPTCRGDGAVVDDIDYEEAKP